MPTWIPTLIVLLAFMLQGCATDDLGKSYPSTQRVLVVESRSDIGRSYEVMGKVRVRVAPYKNPGILRMELIEQAKARGADAMVIKDLPDAEDIAKSTGDKDDTVTGELIKYK